MTDTADAARALRVLRVMETVARSTAPPTLAQLAARMHVPKSTMMRLVRDMQQDGWLVRVPHSGGILPGPRARTLGLDMVKGGPVPRECVAVLRQLVHDIGETCNLTALDGDQVLYIARVEAPHPLGLHFGDGVRVPMHCTASGKLFLAHMPGPARRRMLELLRLDAHTPNTTTRSDVLERELSEPRARRFGVDDEEFILGMVAVAVPILDAQDQMIAAVACHGPTARKTVDELLASLPLLQQAGARLRAILLGAGPEETLAGTAAPLRHHVG